MTLKHDGPRWVQKSYERPSKDAFSFYKHSAPGGPKDVNPCSPELLEAIGNGPAPTATSSAVSLPLGLIRTRFKLHKA